MPETMFPGLPPVSLDAFEGPLDVLLHLIRNQKMDIFDIPIAILAVQYLQILDAQEPLDLEDDVYDVVRMGNEHARIEAERTMDKVRRALKMGYRV